MERTYAFKVKIGASHGNSFLNIKPYIRTNGGKIRKMDPIYFSELNIPIVVNSPAYYSEIGLDCDFFLDFEKGFDGNGECYNCFKRKKQMRILGILEEEVNQDIVNFLSGSETRFAGEKKITFKADDGFSLSLGRKPAISTSFRKQVVARNSKVN